MKEPKPELNFDKFVLELWALLGEGDTKTANVLALLAKHRLIENPPVEYTGYDHYCAPYVCEIVTEQINYINFKLDHQ